MFFRASLALHNHGHVTKMLSSRLVHEFHFSYNLPVIFLISG